MLLRATTNVAANPLFHQFGNRSDLGRGGRTGPESEGDADPGLGPYSDLTMIFRRNTGFT